MACSWSTRLAIAAATFQSFLTPTSAQTDAVTTDTTSQAPITVIVETPIITPTPSPSTTMSSDASSSPQVHTIKAGAGGFVFEPDSISNVSVGDVVTFEFYAPDHSVARAEFGSACVPYEYTGRDKVGFWSETQWLTAPDTSHWNLTINSTEPIFFYCAAPESCTKKHMVGVINPNSTQTLRKQIDSASNADFQVAPGEPIPGEAGSTLVNAPTSAPSAHAAPSSSHSLSAGAIAGIVVGGVAFLAICAALFFFVGRSKTLKEVIKHQDNTNNNTNNNKQTPDPHHSMSTYGNSGLASPFQSSGYPSPTPYSTGPSGADSFVNFNNPPQYGQHYATDQHPSGWGSPPPQHAGFQQGETKYAAAGMQHSIAELHSPDPGSREFRGELEAQDVPKRT